MLSLWPIICLVAGVRASADLPNLDDLLKTAFKDSVPPQFQTISSEAQVAVASNSSAYLKVASLDIEPYPLQPGIVNFTLGHSLSRTIPPGTELHVEAWSGGQSIYSGVVNLCEYLPFAKLPCPVTAYTTPTTMLQRLQIPNEVEPATVSFVAKAVTPENDLVAHIAAIVEVVNPHRHDEL